MLSKKIRTFNKPRFDYAVESAYDFIIEENLNSLPTDPFNICNNRGWLLVKASEFAKSLGWSLNYLLQEKLKTKDGTAIYCPTTKQYKIIYNDTIMYKRIRWTIAHEIAHIILGHLNSERTSLMRGGLSKHEYDYYEQEADCFAGILLAPPIVLLNLGIHTQNQIQDICDLTYSASLARLDYINTIYDYNNFDIYSECILSLFHDFIEKLNCTNCGYSFMLDNSNYCPICGETKLIRDYNRLLWGDYEMKYSGIELNENNIAKVCPRCDNEEIFKGIFCSICGANLYNKCSNPRCGVPLPGNSRYCHICGEESTFLQENFLDIWHNVQKSNDDFLYDSTSDDVPF